MDKIIARPLTASDFAPFGDVINTDGAPDKLINRGRCGRFHDRAALDFSNGNAGISLFKSELSPLPCKVEMVERHPLGSQAFIPMSMDPYLVLVAEGHDPVPGPIAAFVAAPGQAINLFRGTWHGVLSPLSGPGLFTVIDRIGEGDNLEEYWLKEPIEIVARQ